MGILVVVVVLVPDRRKSFPLFRGFRPALGH